MSQVLHSKLTSKTNLATFSCAEKEEISESALDLKQPASAQIHAFIYTCPGVGLDLWLIQSPIWVWKNQELVGLAIGVTGPCFVPRSGVLIYFL